MSKKKNAMYVNGAITLLNFGMLSTVLSTYKDTSIAFKDNMYYQVGVIIIVVALPVISILTYLMYRISLDKERDESVKRFLINIRLFNLFLIVVNLTGFALMLSPYSIGLSNGSMEIRISFSYVFLIGIILSFALYIVVMDKVR